MYDHQTGRSRGFAFIYYRCTEDAVEVSVCLVRGSSHDLISGSSHGLVRGSSHGLIRGSSLVPSRLVSLQTCAVNVYDSKD